MRKIQQIYPEHFSNIKCFTQTILRYVVSENIQDDLIVPKMISKIERIIKLCAVCREQKYDRYPPKPEMKATSIPIYTGEIVPIDIFSTEKIGLHRYRQIF